MKNYLGGRIVRDGDGVLGFGCVIPIREPHTQPELVDLSDELNGLIREAGEIALALRTVASAARGAHDLARPRVRLVLHGIDRTVSKESERLAKAVAALEGKLETMRGRGTLAP